MRKLWSARWKGSKQPRKQRKYSYNAPLGVKRKLMFSANLSKNLREKVGKRTVVLRKGDEVVVKRGSSKGSVGEVIETNIKKGFINIKDLKRKKPDGTEYNVPIKASNVQIIKLNLDDSRRVKGLKTKKAPAKKEKKAKPKKQVKKPAPKKKAPAKKEVKKAKPKARAKAPAKKKTVKKK